MEYLQTGQFVSWMRGPEATVKKAVGVGEDEDIFWMMLSVKIENDNDITMKFLQK